MCFVLRINKQKCNRISKEGLDLSSFYFHVNLSKDLEKYASDCGSGALFFLTTLFHIHFLLHFLYLHLLGHVKQSTFHRASASLQLLRAVDTGRRRRAAVFAGAVFSQHPLTEALLGLCERPRGQKGS